MQRAQEILEEEEALRNKLQQQEKFFIKNVIVEGATLLSEDEIKAAVLPFQKHWLTKDQIKQILTLIIQAYTQKGYPQGPAKISYQIQGKELKIKVKE